MSEPTDGAKQYRIQQVRLDPKLPPQIIEQIVRAQSRYSTTGLVIGAIVFLAGLAMIFLGITGTVDFTFEAGGLKARVTTSVVGAVMMVGGLIIVWITRYGVKVVK